MKRFFAALVFACCSVFSAQGITSEMADVTRHDEAHTVYVTIGVLDVDGINSADQSFTLNLIAQFRWLDPSLAHDGDGPIRENLSDIRAPRFILLNRQRTWSSLLSVVDISPEGEAIYRMRLWGDFSQIMRLQEFPFDAHTFEIPVAAIGYSGMPIQLLPDPNMGSFMAKQFSVADWDINGWSAGPRSLDLIEENQTHGFVFGFEATRKSAHYLIKFIIPLFLIVAMSWVVFWIDPTEASSQLSVAVTAALTLIAYHIALSGQLPDIPYLTRMDLFLFGSTLLVFTSLIEVVLTSRLAKAGRVALARGMDTVCRILFPSLYALIAYLSLVVGVAGYF